MKRLLFNILTAISLLLCIATALLCARSYDVTDFYSHRIEDVEHLAKPSDAQHTADVETGFLSAHGEIGFYQARYLDLEAPLPWSHGVGAPRRLPDDDSNLIGRITCRRFSDRGSALLVPKGLTSYYAGYVVNHWLLVAITAILPIIWASGWRKRRLRRQRAAMGLCERCGYDLRATPGRCPECGAAAPAKARLLIPLLLLPMLGCAAQPENPSFPLETDGARRVLSNMAEHPKPLKRPLVVIGGFMDFYYSAPIYKWEFHRISGDDRIVTVSIAFCDSFADCRQTIIDAVDDAFPNDDPNFTTEVDVVGASLGGLAARFAAAPSPDPAKPRRLRIARLFSIASPHTGATLAAALGFTQFHHDMTPGSPFLEALAKTDVDAHYTVYPYVRLGDWIVGEENAAPPHLTPIWLPTPFLELSHIGAMTDPRILADIARHLRGERPFALQPATPLPTGEESN